MSQLYSDFIPRKIKHNKRKKINKNLNIYFITLWVCFFVILIIKVPIYSAVVLGILFIWLLSLPLGYNKMITIFLFYFILEPASLLLWSLFGISYFIDKVQSGLNATILSIIVLSLIPLFTSMRFWTRFRKDIYFIKKAKVALELHNAIFVSIAGATAIYAFTNNHYDYIKPILNLDVLQKKGLELRDAFTFITAYASFPFLVSGALCKFIIEYLGYKNEEHKAIPSGFRGQAE